MALFPCNIGSSGGTDNIWFFQFTGSGTSPAGYYGDKATYEDNTGVTGKTSFDYGDETICNGYIRCWYKPNMYVYALKPCCIIHRQTNVLTHYNAGDVILNNVAYSSLANYGVITVIPD